MPSFICIECDMLANTAGSNYWTHKKFICGYCDPTYDRKAHPLMYAGEGMFVSDQGFVYGKEPIHAKVIGIVPKRKPPVDEPMQLDYSLF